MKMSHLQFLIPAPGHHPEETGSDQDWSLKYSLCLYSTLEIKKSHLQFWSPGFPFLLSLTAEWNLIVSPFSALPNLLKISNANVRAH